MVQAFKPMSLLSVSTLSWNELSRSIVVEASACWRSPHAHAPSISIRAMPSLTGKVAPNAAQRTASE
jgi:hypothetical protein